MIYLDASALVKLVFDEPESAGLEGWLLDRSDVPRVSSELSTIELLRVCRRRDDESLPEARRLLAGLDLVPIASVVVERAVTAGPPDLRSLDAIHLASALTVREGLVAVVTYDHRLATAATAEQLEVVAPA